MKSKNRIYLLLISAILISSLLLIGCSKKSSQSNSVSPTQSQSTDKSSGNLGLNNEAKSDSSSTGSTASADQSSSGSSTLPQQSSDKIIQTMSLVMETTSFDSTTKAVLQKVSDIGGYVESSSISGISITAPGTSQMRRGSFKLRVPKVNYDKFILDVGSLGNVINRTSSSQNVTLQYFDNEARLNSLKLQEQRLLDILKNTGTLKDMLEIEKELANVRYQIENLTSTQKKLDNLVDYATVNIDLLEVQKLQVQKAAPVTLWQKMSKAFVDSITSLINIFKGLLVVISVIIPYAVVLGILGIPGYYLVRKFLKKKIQ
jgi:hypothetical protein